MKSTYFFRSKGMISLNIVILLGILTSMLIMAGRSVAFYKKISQEERVVENLALIYPAFYDYFYTECSLSSTHSVSNPTLATLTSMGYLNMQPSIVDNPIGSTFVLSIHRLTGVPTNLRLTTTFTTTKRAKRIAKRISVGEATFISPATIQWDLSSIKYRNTIDANSDSYLDDKCK
ncbi:hypothetical protein [Moritella sp. F3]|uniref:hypothetical protein n=1 Tax=Moritella sp. F3 TaxID=2718882 RepID=UPI0018E183F4|nr:hypothetical protein [Moritella sp. F3]